MQEGGQVVSISHPDLQPWRQRWALSGGLWDLHPWSPCSMGDAAGITLEEARSRGVGDVCRVKGCGGKGGTWFQGKLTVKPWPCPCPTASAADSRRWGQKRPCS